MQQGIEEDEPRAARACGRDHAVFLSECRYRGRIYHPERITRGCGIQMRPVGSLRAHPDGNRSRESSSGGGLGTGRPLFTARHR